MLNVKAYNDYMGYKPTLMGGQELLLPEIVALLPDHEVIWIPFAKACKTLIAELAERGHIICTTPWSAIPQQHCDAVYFGTPTIVDNKALFPESAPIPASRWNKALERIVVRDLVFIAQDIGCQRIISGLGSGDISVEERLEDMGGGTVVTMKRFEDFTDWVLARDL